MASINLKKLKTTSIGSIQLDAGMVLLKFTPDEPTEPADEDILCATTGGVNTSCVPAFSDFGEDVDNCPMNLSEFKNLDGWECKMSFTALDISEEMLKIALGASSTSGNKTVLKSKVDRADFKNIWWAGTRVDGKFFAICLKNALSTGGFTLQTTKNGKGQVSVELTGHVSIDTQTEMPMEFYIEQDADTMEASEVKA